MGKRALAILMVALMCVGCLPEENRVHTVSFDGRDDEYEFEDTQYKAGQKVVVYYTAIGTDTDYTFFMNGQKIDPEYEEKGYRIEFEMPANDVVITRGASNSLDPANTGDDGMDKNGGDLAMSPLCLVSFVIDDQWYHVTRDETVVSDYFYKKAESDDLEVTMKDDSFQKSAALPWELSTDLDTQLMAEPLDIVIYDGKTLGLLYKPNTAKCTKVGTLSDGMSLDEQDELIKKLNESKDIKVKVVVEYTE